LKIDVLLHTNIPASALYQTWVYIPANFSIWGTENCEDINYSGQANFIGIIYAPYAELKVSGQGGIIGAVVADKITYSGQGDFHFDLAIYDYDIGSEGDTTTMGMILQY
jgi:hypothetical protein